MPQSGFHDTPLAIIGMACRLPGAENLDEYWQLIEGAENGLCELPPARLDRALYYDADKNRLGKTYARMGGVVAERPFDHAACPIADELVASADPAHLIMLETAASACRHAGLDPLALPLKQTGVYVGHARSSLLASEIVYNTHIEEVAACLETDVPDFAHLPSHLREAVVKDIVAGVRARKPHRQPGGRPHIAVSDVAALITEAFQLSGPYMALDAACASSLYALGVAARALHHGRIEMAIVGGASYSSWQSLVVFAHAQALSVEGVSCPFDNRADGFISSDGYTAMLVKTLPRALADGDTIYGVVRGMGISNDGHGRSLWAPRKEGQIQAIRRAYAHGAHSSGLDPSRLQYVEAHGTSTQLGDATELDALTSALGEYLPAGARLPVTSVKANIGHTRETAGMAGLLKTLLAMQHGVVPPARNFEVPNTQIPWEKIPFFVPTKAAEWPVAAETGLRHAAVDAFGIGGLNVHVVVDSPPVAAPISARLAATLPEPSLVSRNGVHNGVASQNGGAPKAGVSSPEYSAGIEGADAQEAIAVIGMGAIFPGARTIKAFGELLSSGQSALSRVPSERWSAEIFYEPEAAGPWRSPSQIGGFITDFVYDWKKHKIPPKQVEAADPLQFMLLDAADQALRDAGYETKSFDRERTGVVVGSIFGGDFNAHLNLVLRLPEFERDLNRTLREHHVSEALAGQIVARFRDAFLQREPIIHDETGSYSSSTLASRVAKTLDLMGGAFALDAGESSSFAALEAGMDLLQSGACDVVFCAGAQRAMDISAYEVLSLRGLLARDTPRAAFDAAADGFVPGEGVGLLMLKRLGDARRDGDSIRAVITGVGAATDMASHESALRNAMERTLARAHTSPDNVLAVETVGLGAPAFDEQETRALAATYGAAPRARPLALGSLASQIGYTLGASGMASLLKMILAPPGKASGLGGVSTLTYRGLAYHVLLESGPSAPGSATSVAAPVTTTVREGEAWRIVRLGAPALDNLLELAKGSQGKADSLYAAADFSRYGENDDVRLAVVAPDAPTLAKKLRLAAEQIPHAGARPLLEEQGIFCREVLASRPRLALLFPGQGSQYIGMLRDVVREVPAAKAMMDEADAIMARLGYPAFEQIAWDENSPLGSDVWQTQISVLLGDVIVHAALRSLGVRPDVIGGHSYGEYPALVAAGAWTLEQAIRATRARCDFIEASRNASGVMFSTTAPPAVVERLADEIRGVIGVANHNAPDQVVVGGEKEAADNLQVRLEAEGFEVQLLPVPRPFHTPLMAEAQEPLRASLENVAILPPRTPLLSSVTNRYVCDPLDIKGNLVRQLTDPVRYVDLVQRLAADGVTAVIECGPRQVLTRLHRRILPDSAVILVAADNPKRPGLAQLLQVQAALECAGFTIGQSASEERQHAASTPAFAPRANAAIIHFDATQRRRDKQAQQNASTPANGSTPGAAASASAVSAGAAQSAAQDADDLSVFLINFVCEQTGYPPEIVDLDADMEADLGIDSIKKAQLFGELREHFDISLQSAGSLALSDFPTLRHVLEFLRQVGAKADAPAETGTPSTPLVVREEKTPVIESAPPEPQFNLVECAGTHREIGGQHARSQEVHIRRVLNDYEDLLRRRPATKDADLEMLLETAMAQADRYFDRLALDEIEGMAGVLETPVSHLVALNLGMYSPDATGCTQFAVTNRHNNGRGAIHGVNEDWPLALMLPGSLTRAVQLRHPQNGIRHLIFGIAGQVGGLNGINARGVAVTSTTLLDRDASSVGLAPGKIHSVIVRAILEQAEDLESAIAIIESFQRTGAWSLCLSHHPTDSLAYVEYDAKSVKVERHRDMVMTTNHCLLKTPLLAVPEHSVHRLHRLQALLSSDGKTGFTLEEAQSALRDRYDLGRRRETTHPTMNTIQRVDTQLSLVLHPAQGEAWLTPDPQIKDKTDRYYRLDIRRLLESEIAPSESASSESVPNASGRLMNRYVLRMADAPLSTPGAQWRADAPVLILGENATAKALRAHLEKSGASVHELPVRENAEKTLDALNRLWEAQPCPHLFILTGRDEEALSGLKESDWKQRRARGVLLPYLVCQRWMKLLSEADLTSRATLVAVTALGGDFGFSGNVAASEGGALTGLLKAIRREFSESNSAANIRVKAIDTLPEEPPAAVVSAVCAELNAPAPELEVGYLRGRRRVVRAIPRPAAPKREITPGETWIVTGGARGITAIVARELGRRFGLNLHLIGTSPVPRAEDADQTEAELKKRRAKIAREAREAGRDPDAAWQDAQKAGEIARTLKSMADENIRATYHRCDVSDRRALARVLEAIRREAGPIRGIIHGAGIEAAIRFERKQLDSVNATIASKVDGAAALMELTRRDPLAYFVGFGSISGRFGVQGQTDYSLASDWLCKLVQRFRSERPECAAFAFHWPAWGEVGMAVRPETKLTLEIGKLSFMPPLEGVEHLIDELRAGAPEGEVLILDAGGHVDLDAILPAPASQIAYHQRDAHIAASPLIEGVREVRHDQNLIAQSLIAEARFDPARDPFLLQHRLQGQPILPAVVGLEALAEAASLLDPAQKVVALRDVEIENGLRFYNDRAQPLEIHASREGDEVACVLRGAFYNRHGRLIDPQRPYIKGRVEVGRSLPALQLPIPEQPPRWHDMAYLEAGRASKESLVFHGPALRCLHRIMLDREGGWGQIVAPPPNEIGGERAGDWWLPAAALDACLVACAVFARKVLRVGQLPRAFGRLQMGRTPRAGELCTLRLHYRGRQDNDNRFDFALFGDDGEVILQVEDHRAGVVSGKQPPAQDDAPASPLTLPDAPSEYSRSRREYSKRNDGKRRSTS